MEKAGVMDCYVVMDVKSLDTISSNLLNPKIHASTNLTTNFY